MTTQHWKPSSVGELDRVSRAQARQDLLNSKATREGSTRVLPGTAGTVEAHNAWFADNLGRERVLAPPLERLQGKLGPDGLTRKSSAKLRKISDGSTGRQLNKDQRLSFPDERAALGHNLKNRLTLARLP